jgi:nucleoid-associated protein YgaU
VDVPAANIFRLYRQRADGTLTVDAFSLPGRPGEPAYGEMARRVEEATIRQTGRSVADLLAVRPAGPVRVLGETAEFARAQAFVLAGNYGEAARVEGGGARTTDFQNLRGESVRVVEMIAPTQNGLLLRRVVATPRPSGEEQWEETTTILRPVSSWRTEVEVRRATERRSAAGVSLAPRSASAPATFGVDR